MFKYRIPRWFFKATQWFKIWIRLTAKEFFAPFLDGGAFLQFCATLFGLYLVYLASGLAAMKAEIINSWAAQQAIFAVIPAFLVLCAIRAAFRTSKEIQTLGQWFGGKFVYHQPRQLATFHITEADNDNPKPFDLYEKQIGSVVELKVIME